MDGKRDRSERKPTLPRKLYPNMTNLGASTRPSDSPNEQRPDERAGVGIRPESLTFHVDPFIHRRNR
jgi:hypothetical protein